MDGSFDKNDFNNFVITEKQTQTETEKPEKEVSQTETQLPPKQDFDQDDFSVKQNFEEEKSYTIKRQDLDEANASSRSSHINMPLLEREEASVLKEKKTNISARMKLVMTSFIVIVASLLFATVWNFVQVNKINSSIAEREQSISELQISISKLTGEYNMLDDLDHLKSLAEKAGYVEIDDSNSVNISLDDLYVEETVEKIPSNWFNDVCEFITSLFG